jgi:methionyl-tRNA formyltransferase
MRFILFGDGRWAVLTLERLIREGHVAAGVVVRRNPSDGSLSELAAERAIDCAQPADANTSAFSDWVRSHQPDVCISIAYDQIIRRPLLTIAPHGFINAHPGKLPYYRGRSTINWAIINNEPDIGVTVHVMNDGVDTGDILVQRLLPIAWHDTYGSMLTRVQDVVPDVVLEAVDALAAGRETRTPQPALGSYFVARGPGDEWIDWGETSLRIYNKIRALGAPGPGARTRFHDETVVLWTARYDPDWPSYSSTAGSIVGRESAGLRVKTGDSTLLLTSFEVLRASGRSSSAAPALTTGSRFANQSDELNALRQAIAELRALVEKPASF